jgi:hypothetical protein
MTLKQMTKEELEKFGIQTGLYKIPERTTYKFEVPKIDPIIYGEKIPIPKKEEFKLPKRTTIEEKYMPRRFEKIEIPAYRI